MTLAMVITDVVDERAHQNEKWGGPEHDDQHAVLDWASLIVEYVGKLAQSGDTSGLMSQRKVLVQIAALAIAAVESGDRRAGTVSW